ncbi:transcription initiation factor IIA subunit 1 [Culicoides brevitarsis]|uniref:transcription initiation factor IIA subunit 1 n=1 Tax=Culicoides brevitarsis TaxID=469753 RepID=UPI00307B7ACE
MSLSQSTVLKLYHTVIDDVIAGVRDPFMDEGVDEQVLQELKQVWTNKLMASKAVEMAPDPSEQPVPPPSLANNPKSSSKSGSKSKSRAAQQAAASNNDNKTMMTGNTTASSTSLPAPPAAVIGLDPNKLVPIQITLPAMPGVIGSEARVLTITVPASALQENQLHQVITGPIITSIMPLPPQIASSVLQQHVNSQLQNVNMNRISVQKQMDGAADTSDEEDVSDISDDHLDNDDDNLEKSDDENMDGAEEEPLNSEDDVTDEESSELFETDNVVVCQYDKITRSRNKWKFYLKDGIMNVNGKDYVFQKSNGDAEW